MLHPTVFDYIMPTKEQLAQALVVRNAAQQYAFTLDQILPDGPDKTYLLRKFREVNIWALITITRTADGTPRAPALETSGSGGTGQTTIDVKGAG